LQKQETGSCKLQPLQTLTAVDKLYYHFEVFFILK